MTKALSDGLACRSIANRAAQATPVDGNGRHVSFPSDIGLSLALLRYGKADPRRHRGSLLVRS